MPVGISFGTNAGAETFKELFNELTEYLLGELLCGKNSLEFGLRTDSFMCATVSGEFRVFE